MPRIFATLADLITYDLLNLEKGGHFSEAVHFFILDTAKIFFLLTVLLMLVGFLRTWISPEKIRLWLQGKPRALGYLLAVGLGAVTPFCSCSSIPLFIAFIGSGFPLGIAMAFLITSPMVNEVAAILFGEAIGWHFMFAYIAAGMVIGVTGGILADRLKLDKWIEPFVFESNSPRSSSCSCKCKTAPDLRMRLNAAWRETLNVVKNVWLYILVGVAAGAAIHGFVPQEWFLRHAGEENLFAVPTAVIMAVPLYSSVTGTVPVAEVLIAKGLPVGTTLAFIMSTVAISMPELLILRRVMLPKLLACFTIYLALAFILLGYLFNWLF